MKRTCLIALRCTAALFMTAAVAACGSADKPSESEVGLTAQSSFADSLSWMLGEQWGAQQSRIFASLPEDIAGRLDRKAFLEGLRAALTTDFSTPGVKQGLFHGTQIASTLDVYDAVGLRLNREKVADAFASAFSSQSMTPDRLAATQADFDRLMTDVQHARMEKMRADRRRQFELERIRRNENLEAAKAFIAKLKVDDPSVIETPSGLVYKIRKTGSGSKPNAKSTVGIVYQLATTNGSIIDSSRGEIIDLPLSGSVIDGLKEGLQLLGQGAEATFYIPDKLGFTRPTDGIEPGQMIVVDVKLVNIK